jgi:hypothetical protein
MNCLPIVISLVADDAGRELYGGDSKRFQELNLEEGERIRGERWPRKRVSISCLSCLWIEEKK